MHIVISGAFWNQPTVGSGQYLHGLMKALVSVAPEHRYSLLLPADPPPSVRPPNGVETVRLRTPFGRFSRNIAKLWFEQIGVPLATKRLQADLLHVPYFAPPLRATVPVVTTILDIIPLLLPEYRGNRAVRAYMRLVATTARFATQIITISDHARADIVTHLGCKPSRVTTVPLAASDQYHPLDHTQAAAYISERYDIHAPFIYYVGGLDARKNLGTLIRAFARLCHSGGPPATLVIAGRRLGNDPVLFPDLDKLIAELGIKGAVQQLDVSRADNPIFYAAATLFAYPSRYEGFGLPPLEAMACGTPVVVAEASSLPEVVGDAALRVNPDDTAAWTVALWRLLADPELRTHMRLRGLERAKLFSYQRVAHETLAIYQRAVMSISCES